MPAKSVAVARKVVTAFPATDTVVLNVPSNERALMAIGDPEQPDDV